jgi:DHA2 family methylenomycin A resistance protein-like MFS transporter
MVLAVLVVAQVLGVANANLIAVALPPLSEDLGASGVQQQWIVDAYVLVFAALLITGGVLGDRLGRRRTLITGLAVFAAGSLACAVAEAPGLLIAARVLQGLGPPLILPASLALVSATYVEPGERARAIGLWGTGSGIGIAIGPLLGGLVEAGLGWRWTFAFNVPVALALALAALMVIPRDAAPTAARAPFDRAGAVLVTLTMAAAVFAIIEGPDSRGLLAGAAVATVVFAAVFLRVEARSANPLIDLGLLRNRTFAAANVCAATVMFAILPATVYLSSFLQTFRSLSPLEAGVALLPLGAAVALTAGVTGRLVARVGPRPPTAAGLIAAAAGTAALSSIGPGDGAGDVWLAMVLLGVGAGLAMPASTAVAVSAAPLEKTGQASAIHNAGRQLGATLGVAVLGSIILSHADDGAAAAFCDGLQVAMLVATGALIAAAACSPFVRVAGART